MLHGNLLFVKLLIFKLKCWKLVEVELRKSLVSSLTETFGKKKLDFIYSIFSLHSIGIEICICEHRMESTNLQMNS